MEWLKKGETIPVTTTILVLLFLFSGLINLSAEESGETSAPRSWEDESYQGWLQAETEHFRLIYEPRDREIAGIFASVSEGVYKKVTAYFDRRPEKITCIIQGRFDAPNGSYSLLPDKITLYTAPLLFNSLSTQCRSWAEMLLTHELTHYLHITDPRGMAGFFGRLFGSSLTAVQGAMMPGWYVEGITTNTETRFTQGGRGRNPYFEAVYKAMVMEDRLFTPQQSEFYAPRHPPGRIYVAGYMIVDYLMDTYGEEVFAEINREYIRFPLWGIYPAIHKVTGSGYREIFAAMEERLLARYGRLPSTEAIHRTAHPVGTALPLPAGDRGFLFYETPPGRSPQLIFRPAPPAGNTDQSAKADLSAEPAPWPMTPAGPSLTASLTGPEAFTYSPQADIVLFSSYRTDPLHPAGTRMVADLHRWSPGAEGSRGRVEPLTRGQHLLQPALSPRGDRAAAVQIQGLFSRLVMVSPETGEVTPLFSTEGGVVSHPRWSPDGEWIAFSHKQGLTTRIALIQPDKGMDSLLYPGQTTAGSLGEPQWNPRFGSDGALFFTLRDAEGNLLLARYLVDGEEEPRLRAVAADPAALLEGYRWQDHLIYTAQRAEGPRLFLRPWTDTSGGVPAAGVPAGGLALGVPEENPEPLPAAEEAGRALTGESAYIDLPRPLLWLPYPAINLELEGSPAAPLGAGFFFYGGSYLGSRTWEAVLNIYPEFQQLGGSLLYTRSFAGAAYTLSFQQGYKNITPFPTAETETALTFSRPLLYGSTPARSYALSVIARAAGTAQTMGADDFTLLDTLQALTETAEPHTPADHLLVSRALSATLGLSYADLTTTAPPHLYGGPANSLALTGYYTPPLLSRKKEQVQIILEAQTRQKAGPSRWQLSLKTGWSQGQQPSTTIFPRGFTRDNLNAQARDRQGAAPLGGTLAADWLLPLGYPDLTLPLTPLHLSAAGLGLHVEGFFGTADDGTILGGAPSLDPALYTGAEVSLLLGYYHWLEIPLTIGFNTRLSAELSAASAEEIAEGLGAETVLYIALSLNSALDGSQRIDYNSDRRENTLLRSLHP